eukprot:6897413-Prymnesium_polylepis.2
MSGSCCPEGHPMKRHCGRRDGQLQCDGPDDNPCCGGDGVLHPGVPRWSCERCDYDICVECADSMWEEEANSVGGVSQAQKQENYDQAIYEQDMREAMFGEEAALASTRLGSNGREVRKPKLKARPEKKAAVELSAEERAAAVARADAAAAALLAELEGEAAPAAAPAKVKQSKKEAAAKKGAAAADAASPAADTALRCALQAAEKAGVAALEALKNAIADGADGASADLLGEARKVRDKLKKKARKAPAPEPLSPMTPTPAVHGKAAQADLPAPCSLAPQLVEPVD